MTKRTPPKRIDDKQQEWTLRLSRAQVIVLDAILAGADHELVHNSGCSGPIPAAQRAVQTVIREVRAKWLS